MLIRLTNSQCFHPEIKQINFYSENDRYFGHFLRDTCYNSRSICMKFALFSFLPILSSPKCQKPLYQHQIIILHNGFQLTISSSIVGNARHQSDVIRTWRFAFLPLLTTIQSMQMRPRNAPRSGQQRSALLVRGSRSAADFLRYG